MSEKISIRGVQFDDVNLEEALAIVDGFIAGEKKGVVHTPNSEIVQLCVEQPSYYDLINAADLIIPDGSGVILASKILKTPLAKGKVAGVDLAEKTLCLAAGKGYKVFFLGGKPGVAELAAEKMSEKYPGLMIAGVHDGYFEKTGAESDAVAAAVNESGAQILFVCLGVPVQEEWMRANRDRLQVNVMMGLGGSLDVFAGTAKRAPKIFIKLGLEWFYRLLKQPSRIGRMMKLPRFLIGTMFSKKTKSKEPVQ
ncbi:MAG: WecB/TagA/CpsF family glycosyltransferase [Clostridiales bacterium]|nr:WecB/TagA/CpsF family glycosyltransferase [Clostridiales bacterium]